VGSRIGEVNYEIQYGEKKDMSGWTSQADLLLGGRSGRATPRTPGMRTPGDMTPGRMMSPGASYA